MANILTFEQPHERIPRLHQLGLDEGTFETAALRGVAARLNCTAFHPPSYPGYTQWAETHCGLRELLVPREWTPDDTHNYSRLISPDRRTALTVATGDHNTGVVDNQYGPVQPHTKNTKGTETRLAVEANLFRQLSLLERVVPLDGDATPPLETWFMLIAVTERHLRYELSRARGQDRDGHVISWWERIIFPAIDLETVATRIVPDDDPGQRAIEVPVERI